MVQGHLSIVSPQPNTLAIDESRIHYTVSISCATLAPANEPPTKSSQRLKVKEEHPTKVDTCKQNTKREPSEYPLDQTRSHEDSEDDLCYHIFWYWLSTDLGTLKPAKNLL